MTGLQRARTITSSLVLLLAAAASPASEPAQAPVKPAAAVAADEAASATPGELWQAARAGDVARVKALLAAGVPVDARTEFDVSALYFAANANRPEVIAVLAAAGADLTVKDNDYGFSAMSMAAWLGHTEAVEALIEAGVPAGEAIGGFFAAVSNGHGETMRAILARGLVPAPQIDAAVGVAMRSGHPQVVEVLRAAGATAEAAAPEEPEAAAGARAADAAEAVARALDAELDKPRPVGDPRNWPEFRGPARSGVADGQHPPASWDLESGRNVLWRVAVEGLGHSSPVVWGDRVFITTATSELTEQSVDDRGRGWINGVEEAVEHTWELHAYGLASGELLWKRVARTGVPVARRHWKASQANPTCATNGEVVVASFGAEGLYAYDLDGELLWRRELGRLNAGWYVDATFEWGYASSPVLWRDRVIVQADVHGRSFVAAYALADGRELWRTERDELPAWGTPTVVPGSERDELVLNASKAIVAYDPADGRELWRIRGNSPITVASPIAGDGLIVASGGYRTPKPIYVVRAGGARGDVTPPDGEGNAAVAWSSQTDGVYGVTPLLYRGVLYLCRNNGVLLARDAASGEELYKERLGGRYTASPVAADGRIYFTAEDGVVTVVEAGREFRVLTRNELGAPALATPAISAGKIVLRTVRELIGVGWAGGAPEVAP